MPTIYRLIGPLGLIVGAAACNALTGVDDLQVTGGSGGGQKHDGSRGAGANSGSNSNSGAGVSAGGAGPGSSGAVGGSIASSGGGTSSTGGPACSPACGANQYCETSTATCVCDPDFVRQGGACVAAAAGDPSTHAQTDVCNQWDAGHVVTDSNPLSASGADCDAGTLSQAGIVDTLTRINMFRWMTGLGPVTDDPALDANEQLCANLEAWWDFTSMSSPHAPPSSTKCYTAQGGTAAGSSNIAWGSGSPGQAIDQFIQDDGNATTLGHRRWILNPPLDPVGVGYWQTGGMYGNAECLGVFGTSGTGPNPSWVSMPPAGFVPLVVTQWTWSFHGSLGGTAGAQVAMLRVDDDTPLAVTMQALGSGYGQDATSWTPNGWATEVGKTYRVTVSGLTGGDVVYDVKPVTCP